MVQLQRSHPGYFRVVLAVSMVFYFCLGMGFMFFQPHLKSSPSYYVMEGFLPLWAWGLLLVTLGTSMLLAATVKRFPHHFLKKIIFFGMMVDTFWLLGFTFGAFIGKLDAFTLIFAWATVLLVEYAAFMEKEVNPTMVK